MALKLIALGKLRRAGVVAATLFALVARVYSRPLGVVGTVSGLPVAPRLLDVDGDAQADEGARSSGVSDAKTPVFLVVALQCQKPTQRKERKRTHQGTREGWDTRTLAPRTPQPLTFFIRRINKNK